MTCRAPTVQETVAQRTQLQPRPPSPCTRGNNSWNPAKIFTNMPVYLSEPYQKTSFVVFCRRITSSAMVGFLNKVVLLLCQWWILHGSKWWWHTESLRFWKCLDFYWRLVLKMPSILKWFFAWIFRIPSSISRKNWIFLTNFIIFYKFFKVKNTVNWKK